MQLGDSGVYRISLCVVVWLYWSGVVNYPDSFVFRGGRVQQ